MNYHLTVIADSLDLDNEARINASTFGEGGVINLQIADNITLDNNSFISARAFGEADGGNLNIDAGFIIAFPSNGSGNDLVATAEEGQGGNINLNAEQIFGLQPGNAIDRENNSIVNQTNDVDASSNVDGLDGNININTSSINPIQGATELPSNIVAPEQTTAQACDTNRRTTANNALTIKGKGGIPAEPGLPLNSLNAINNDRNPRSTIPAPIETSKGKIQPARGIEVTKDGDIRLIADRTNSAGDRLTDHSLNCGGV